MVMFTDLRLGQHLVDNGGVFQAGTSQIQGLKADSAPYNVVQVEEFTGKSGDTQDDVLGAVLVYIEDLAWERDVSSAIHYKPFECARRQGWNWRFGCPYFDSEQENNSVARDAQQEPGRGQHVGCVETASFG
ncbi:hypothetical protein MBLNU13_g02305t1 [Cladosporium sp. NU13]